jgi:hypothetical protein
VIGLVADAALLLTAGGVVCVVCAVAFAAAWRPGLHMALDLWVGAGLLRLTGDPGAADLLVAASVIAVRQLVAVRLRTGDRSLAAGGHGG